MVNVLIAGGSGFLGRRLAQALRERGHALTLVGRHRPAGLPADVRWLTVDLGASDVPAWRPHLAGIDVVVNAVGILRESRGQSFHALHVAGPTALFDACVAAGVHRVVQVSALGADSAARSPYHRSKLAADEHLLSLPLDAVVVQPSLVFGVDGASAALFLRLAVLPVLPLPVGGRQPLQPVHVDDVIDLLCRLVEGVPPPQRRIAAVGPRALSFADYLQTLRAALGLRPALVLAVPGALVRRGAAVAGRWRGSPLDLDTWRMLERGNTAAAHDIAALLHRPPRDPSGFIPDAIATPLRQAAQLDVAAPLLRGSLALVWLWTAAVSFGLYPVTQSLALLARAGVPAAWQPGVLFGAAGLDLALGLATLRLRSRWLWLLQALLILGYTAIITWRLPEFWLHPYGPILKNLPILALLGLLALRDAPTRKAARPWTT